MDPASIAFAALAEEYRRSGNYEEAIATCRTGLQRHPAYLSARVTLGRALLETGQYADARTELEYVLRTAPENLAAIRGLAELHNRGRDVPETEPPVAPPAPAAAPAAPAAPPPAAVAAPLPAVAAPLPAAVVPLPAPVAPPLAVSEGPAVSHDGGPSQNKAAQPAPVRMPTPQAVVPPIPVVTRPAGAAAVKAPAIEAAVAVAPRVPHPDEAALPALEAFLSAAVAARRSVRRVSN